MQHIITGDTISSISVYRLVDRNGVTAAVDPVEPSKVIEAAKKEGLKISTVLTTHHHWCTF